MNLKLRWHLFKRRIRRFINETQTCPRRTNEIGPWDREEGLDWWERRGPDRVCSFCGSMHPEDFEAFVDRILEDRPDDEARLEFSDKTYKVYVHRPEIRNAGEGAIKFYIQHAQACSEDHRTRVAEKLSRAAKISRRRYETYLSGICKRMSR